MPKSTGYRYTEEFKAEAAQLADELEAMLEDAERRTHVSRR